MGFRLPNLLTSMVEISDRFHAKPILRSLTFPHHAYVLPIGMGAVRLVEISADLPPHVVPVAGLPTDAASALGGRSHTERTGPMRSGTSTGEHAILVRYARAVDQALRPPLNGEAVPLIVAAAEPMASIFRNATSYGHVAPRVITGSAEDTPDHVLAAEARKVREAVYADAFAACAALYAEREARGRATLDGAQAARAATFGAVDTVLVHMDSTVSGMVDESDGGVTFDDRPDAVNYGVVDEIACRTLRAGVRVLAVRRDDIPGKGELAAILRSPD